MTWQIVIDFEGEQASITFVHQLRNFGEDLFRACKQDGWASMGIADIDRATDQLIVTVSSARRVRRTVNMTRKLLDKHFLARNARISEVNVGP